MRKTKNLKLPIYDNPSEDKFLLSDWNTANESIESAFDSVLNGEALDIVNSEVVEARMGNPTLAGKIVSIDTEIIRLTDFLNYMPVNGGTFDDFDGNESTGVLIDGGVY